MAVRLWDFAVKLLRTPASPTGKQHFGYFDLDQSLTEGIPIREQDAFEFRRAGRGRVGPGVVVLSRPFIQLCADVR
jgi:hypothetical protein